MLQKVKENLYCSRHKHGTHNLKNKSLGFQGCSLIYTGLTKELDVLVSFIDTKHLFEW